MLALGIGVILLIVFAAILRAGIALGAAYALTTLVALPSLVSTLAWIAAGGFAALQFVGAGVAILALLNAGDAARRFR